MSTTRSSPCAGCVRPLEVADVVNCVWRYGGPVIAVGNPRETLSPLGDAREYVPQDQWQEAIQRHLDETVLVVSVLGFNARAAVGT